MGRKPSHSTIETVLQIIMVWKEANPMTHEFIQGKGKTPQSQYCLLLRTAPFDQQKAVHTGSLHIDSLRTLLEERYGYSKVRSKFELTRLVSAFYAGNTVK